jgi:hypothetical protein
MGRNDHLFEVEADDGLVARIHGSRLRLCCHDTSASCGKVDPVFR